MSAHAHRAEGPSRVGFAVITVSDTRTSATDKSGPLVRALAESAGHAIARVDLTKDEAPEIRAAVARALDDPAVDAIVLTGGTGVAPRDVTPEAIEALFEKPLPGFGELFRFLSYEEVGAAAMLSRATAGLARGKPVFALPGSTAACRLAMERLILPEVAHVVRLARG